MSSDAAKAPDTPPPAQDTSSAYKRFHDRRPHTTQVLQSMAVGFIGDSLSQLVISPENEYQPLRTVKVLLTGSILSLPTYRWFLFMARRINHPNKFVSLAMKIVANQTCFAPFFLSSFISSGLVFQGITDPNEILATLKQRVPVAWMNGCMFWPNIVILNFTLIPPHFRGLVNSAAGVVWQAYLSWLTYSSKTTVQQVIDKEIAFEHKVEHKVAEGLHLDRAKVAVLATERKVPDAASSS